MKLEINVTKNRSGQSDRHSQICDCQNSINDKFVPDNVRDRTLISRHGCECDIMAAILGDTIIFICKFCTHCSTKSLFYNLKLTIYFLLIK